METLHRARATDRIRRRGRRCAKRPVGGTPRYGCTRVRCSNRCPSYTATRPTIATGNSVRDLRGGKSPRRLYLIGRGKSSISRRATGLFKSPDFRMVERCVGRRRPPGGGSRFFLSAGCRACGADSGCPGGLRTRRLCLVSRTGERGCVGGMRRSARRRVHDGIKGLLWSGGVVSVGGGGGTRTGPRGARWRWPRWSGRPSCAAGCRHVPGSGPRRR